MSDMRTATCLYTFSITLKNLLNISLIYCLLLVIEALLITVSNQASINSRKEIFTRSFIYDTYTVIVARKVDQLLTWRLQIRHTPDNYDWLRNYVGTGKGGWYCTT